MCDLPERTPLVCRENLDFDLEDTQSDCHVRTCQLSAWFAHNLHLSVLLLFCFEAFTNTNANTYEYEYG